MATYDKIKNDNKIHNLRVIRPTKVNFPWKITIKTISTRLLKYH